MTKTNIKLLIDKLYWFKDSLVEDEEIKKDYLKIIKKLQKTYDK